MPKMLLTLLLTLLTLLVLTTVPSHAHPNQVSIVAPYDEAHAIEEAISSSIYDGNEQSAEGSADPTGNITGTATVRATQVGSLPFLHSTATAGGEIRVAHKLPAGVRDAVYTAHVHIESATATETSTFLPSRYGPWARVILRLTVNPAWCVPCFSHQDAERTILISTNRDTTITDRHFDLVYELGDEWSGEDPGGETFVVRISAYTFLEPTNEGVAQGDVVGNRR